MENIITNWMMTPYKFKLSSIGRPNEGYIPCEQCGTFRWVAFGHKTRFCSQICYGKWRSKKFSGANAPRYKGGDVPYECEYCHIIFYGKRSAHSRFCNGTCFGKWMSENCIGEDNPFFGKHHSDETKQLISDSQTGDDNYWRKSGETNHAAIAAMTKKRMGMDRTEEERIKISCTLRNISIDEFDGFVSGERKKFVASSAYIKWRTSVFERDDYTCQECSNRGGHLNVHHLLPYKDYPDEQFSLNMMNGITLCRKCHEKTFGKEYEYFNEYHGMLIAAHNEMKEQIK